MLHIDGDSGEDFDWAQFARIDMPRLKKLIISDAREACKAALLAGKPLDCNRRKGPSIGAS